MPSVESRYKIVWYDFIVEDLRRKSYLNRTNGNDVGQFNQLYILQKGHVEFNLLQKDGLVAMSINFNIYRNY